MAGPLGRLRQRMARDWQLRQLRDERWRFLWDEPPPNEWVSFDCETTGLDTRNDEIVAIGAVRIRGQRIMTSERLELLVRAAATDIDFNVAIGPLGAALHPPSRR